MAALVHSGAVAVLRSGTTVRSGWFLLLRARLAARAASVGPWPSSFTFICWWWF